MTHKYDTIIADTPGLRAIGLKILIIPETTQYGMGVVLFDEANAMEALIAVQRFGLSESGTGPIQIYDVTDSYISLDTSRIQELEKQILCRDSILEAQRSYRDECFSWAERYESLKSKLEDRAEPLIEAQAAKLEALESQLEERESQLADLVERLDSKTEDLEAALELLDNPFVEITDSERSTSNPGVQHQTLDQKVNELRDSKNPNSLASNLRAMRMKKGWKKGQVAQAIKVSVESVRRWEKGELPGHKAGIMQIAKFLGLSFHEVQMIIADDRERGAK